MFKKMLSLLLAVMMVVSVMAVGVVTSSAATTAGFTPEATKIYFDIEGAVDASGNTWSSLMGTKGKVAFYFAGGDLDTPENPTKPIAWGGKKAIGAATAGETGIWEFDPGAKLGTLNDGVQYKLIFVRVDGSNWKEQTYDLFFTTDCLGHVAKCDGTMTENPVDSSKKALTAYWDDAIDPTENGPVKAITSIGNVVGSCLEQGKTDVTLLEEFFTEERKDFQNKTSYQNAHGYVCEISETSPNYKSEQKLIDDIGAGLGLSKDEVKAVLEEDAVVAKLEEMGCSWSYDDSTLHGHTPGEPVQENVVPATYKAGGSYDSVVYCSDPECGKEISRETITTDPVTLDSNKIYFDTDGTGWEMGTKNKVAFHIFGGDIENGLAWGAKKAIGTATANQSGVFEIDPVAKLGITLNEGVQYKIIFVRTEGANWTNQTYDLLFTTDCLGHIAYCDGTEYENPVDSSKKTLAAFWYGMDASVVGPVKQISSIGNVVGTCLAEGTTDESLFTDFLTVVDSTTGKTKYENAYQFVVEPGTKTDQKLIDDIGTDLGLTKQQVFDAFYNNNIETTWDYTVSALPGNVTPPHTHTPGDPVIENDHASTCTTAGFYEEVIYCTGCHEELSRETKYHELAAHTPGTAVRENVVPATCKAAGSYDEVVYCTSCHAELSRTTKAIKKLAHTPGDPVIENDHASTCTVKGAYDEVTYCTACQAELSRQTKYHDLAPHTPGAAVHENEVVSHDKTTYDEVVKCTVCQAEISRTPVELPIITHTLTYVPEAPATEQATGTKAHYTCSGCTKFFADAAGTQEVTAASLIIPKLDHVHTPGTAVRENVVPATCKAAGSYDVVVYCTSCHAELSRTTKTIKKLAHTPGTSVIENDHASTCTVKGAYDEVTYCTACQTELSRQTKYHDLAPHTPGAAVHEKEAVTHDKTTYDEVVYCTVCQAEISRTPVELPIITHTLTYVPEVPATEQATGTKAHYTCSGCDKLFADASGKQEVTAASLIIPKLDHVHTPGEAVRENVVPATCKAKGSYDIVVYCTSCHAELSRTTKTIKKLAHTPGEAVRENDVPATCKAEGSYDMVVYCTKCNEEISREHKTIDKLAHTLKLRKAKEATTEEDGWKRHYYCTECGKYFADANGTKEVTWEQVRIPRIVIGKLGDIDGDGIVTILDVTQIQRVLAGIKTADDIMKKLGDVNGDGDITITDATLLQRWLLGLNQDLKIGEDV